MRTSTKRLLAVAAMFAAALFATAASAQRYHGAVANRDGAHFYRLGELVPFDGINVERRDSENVDMSVLRRDGSWLPLKQQSSATCATGCPEGQTLECWEDEEKLVCICECKGGGGGGRLPTIVIVAGGDDLDP